MFIDASALCGIITNEPDAGELFQRLVKADQRITSPLAFVSSYGPGVAET